MDTADAVSRPRLNRFHPPQTPINILLLLESLKTIREILPYHKILEIKVTLQLVLEEPVPLIELHLNLVHAALISAAELELGDGLDVHPELEPVTNKVTVEYGGAISGGLVCRLFFIRFQVAVQFVDVFDL